MCASHSTRSAFLPLSRGTAGTTGAFQSTFDERDVRQNPRFNQSALRSGFADELARLHLDHQLAVGAKVAVEHLFWLCRHGHAFHCEDDDGGSSDFGGGGAGGDCAVLDPASSLIACSASW